VVNSAGFYWQSQRFWIRERGILCYCLLGSFAIEENYEIVKDRLGKSSQYSNLVSCLRRASFGKIAGPTKELRFRDRWANWLNWLSGFADIDVGTQLLGNITGFPCSTGVILDCLASQWFSTEAFILNENRLFREIRMGKSLRAAIGKQFSLWK